MDGESAANDCVPPFVSSTSPTDGPAMELVENGGGTEESYRSSAGMVAAGAAVVRSKSGFQRSKLAKLAGSGNCGLVGSPSKEEPLADVPKRFGVEPGCVAGLEKSPSGRDDASDEVW